MEESADLQQEVVATESVPDYGRCSLDELYEVRRRIDAEAHPQRTQAVEREIARRLALPEVQRAIRKAVPFRVFRRTVAGAEFVGGLVGIVSVLSALWSVLVVGRSPQGHTIGFVVGLLVVLIVYLLSTFAGRELYRGRRVGVALSAVALGAQAISFRMLGLAYEVALPGSLYLYLPPGQLRFRLGSHWGVGWSQTDAPTFIGINLVAWVMLGLTMGPLQADHQHRRAPSERPV